MRNGMRASDLIVYIHRMNDKHFVSCVSCRITCLNDEVSQLGTGQTAMACLANPGLVAGRLR